jgi:hypothetical protein
MSHEPRRSRLVALLSVVYVASAIASCAQYVGWRAQEAAEAENARERAWVDDKMAKAREESRRFGRIGDCNFGGKWLTTLEGESIFCCVNEDGLCQN